MFIMYDYKCESCSHTFESLEERETRTTVCPECNGVANKLVSPVRCQLDGASGDFPGEAMKWERRHR